jgi:hypothetical protein
MMAWIEMGSVTSETGGRSAERFAFRQTANVAQAFGHDAQAWAKYQCQSCGVNFQGDFARQFKIQLKLACLK